jgi:hypothetical protein
MPYMSLGAPRLTGQGLVSHDMQRNRELLTGQGPRTRDLRRRRKLSYPGSKKHRTEVYIHVPRMFNHMHSNNMINRCNVSITQSNIPYIMTRGSEKDYLAENNRIRLSVVQLPQA